MLQVESIVRSHGAVPATMAVVGGVPKAGLTSIELEALAAKGPSVRKTSVRDLPIVVAKVLSYRKMYWTCVEQADWDTVL